MWITIIGYCITTLLLSWLLFGYVIWLRSACETRMANPIDVPTSYPKTSVIVPCFNEESLITDKYHNLIKCEYPAEKLEIIFADGGSEDGTVERLRSLARKDQRVRVIECPCGGKINQLNYVLPKLTGEIVVVSDADARLDNDALMWMVAEFEADPEVEVVGAYTSPRGGLSIERCYWVAQNRIRLLESRMSHVSMVVACCYAFKRDLLGRFPEDVIADDVYVAALANTYGRRAKYSTRARAEELRSPHTIGEWLSHKFRKSNAVFREMLRISYRVPEMNGPWKRILFTRLVQQILLPWGTVLWLVFFGSLVNLGMTTLPCVGVVTLLTLLLVARRAVTSVDLPTETEQFGPVTIVLAYMCTMLVLCLTVVTYLSFRQSSSYKRLEEQPTRTRTRDACTNSRQSVGVCTTAVGAALDVPLVREA